MHSSRMRTARSLTVSRGICQACPLAMHAPHHAPPCHACHPATHAALPHMPTLPHTPYHACPHPVMHAPLPHMPPAMHPPPCTPPPCTHPRHSCPPSPCHASPPCHVPPLWTETLTHATQNITLPQTSFAGGKDSVFFYFGIFHFRRTSHWIWYSSYTSVHSC